MKRIVVLAFLILLATSTSIMAVELADVNGSKPDVPSFVGYAPNRIVVNFDPSMLRGLDKAAMARGRTGIPALDHVGSLHGVMSIHPQFPGAKKKDFKGEVIDLAGWHKVKFSRNVDVLAVVEEYKAIPGVIDAQPVGIHRVAETPNDPLYTGYQWHLQMIDMPFAWDVLAEEERGNPAIIVAVLDTGVRYFHKDLGGPDASLDNPTAADGNMWINLAEKNGTPGIDDNDSMFNLWQRQYVDDWIGWDFVDDPCGPPGAFLCYPCCCADGEDCIVPDNDPRDSHGHGTHCAGNVSAMNNNGSWTASPAGGWGDGGMSPFGNGIKVMALRIGWDAVYVFYEAGMVSMDYAAEALYYAANNGAKIASCSWMSDNSGGIEDAIDYFVGMGGLIFKAAGNDSTETADYMCSREDVICVAATDQGDCKASFSTYGTWVDISAPGVQIGSLYHLKGDPANDYAAQFDGTSMATPLAASVAALIWSQYTNLSADDVKNILFASADSDIYTKGCNSSFDNPRKLGAGRIDAYQAVLAVGPPSPNAPPAITSGPSATPSTITDAQTSSLSVTASDADGDTLSYFWSATGGSVSGTGATAVYTPDPVTAVTVHQVNVVVSDEKGGIDTGLVDVTVSPSVGPNLALLATASASSVYAGGAYGQFASKAVDGIVDGYPGDSSKEWASDGELAGAWITLEWSTFQSITQIKLYDRPNLTDEVLSGRLLFSDGGSINVGALPNNGSAFTVDFPTKSVTWVSFQIDSAVGENIGLAEFEVYETVSIPSNTPPSISAGPTATPSTITDAQTSSLSVTASDADGDTLSYSWSATGGSVSGTGATAVYTPPRVTAVTVYQVNVTVSDGKGGTAAGSVDVTVSPRPAPSATVGVVEPLVTGKYGTFGSGKDKYTQFIPLDPPVVFYQGDEVIIQATVKDFSEVPVVPMSGAIVEITISGPEAATIPSGPSNNNGIAEAKWKTSAPKGKRGGTTPGTYTATVTGVTAVGYTWDGNMPSTSFEVQ